MTAKKEILHLAQDEKFINAANYLFEKAFPGANRFVIIKPQANPKTKYIKDNDSIDLQYEIRSSDTLDRLLKISDDHEVTVLHGLDKLKGALYLESDHKKRFMTIIYGAEIYNEKIIENELYGHETRKLYESLQKENIIDAFKDVYRKLRYSDYNDIRDVNLKDILYKIKVFGSLPSFSYQKLIDKGIYNPSVKKIPFTYYPIEYIIENEDLRANGRDILLGNSASATNNHLEAMKLLNRQNLKGRDIYTPLSYGRKKYANAIISEGRKNFPERFKPLTEFLPLEKYNEIISRCGIVIMNHYRPQGMGNIIASLYMGAKVFLNDTAAYDYFKNLGCHIYLVNKDLIKDEHAFELLTDEQVNHNRNVLSNELSTPVLVNKLRKSFKEIFDYEQKLQNSIQ